MTGPEYRAAILSTGLSITAYAKHIGLTRNALLCRFRLAKVTNEMALAVERVAQATWEQQP
jgi:plasmid maintenance system antidote protein VapI